MTSVTEEMITEQSTEERKDYGYRQHIEKLEGSAMYVRIDTGPDLQEAWLCLDDGEPDTHHVAQFISVAYANGFVQFWNRRASLKETTNAA